MKKNKILIIFATVLIVIAGIGIWQRDAIENLYNNMTAQEPDTADENNSVQKEETTQEPEDQIQSMLAGMTLEEKVAQLFYVTPEELTGVEVVVQSGDTTKRALEQYPVGGIIYFGQNIQTPDQLTEMIANTKADSSIPLFIGVDEEGGTVARIANADGFSVEQVGDMEAVGATRDINEAKRVGTTIAEYLQPYGFNMDFAPDADVLTNPNNTVIGNRSFGSDPTVVADMVAQEVTGLQESGISATLKHFPGHGDTAGDSHEGSVIVDKSLGELQQTELVPFEAGISAGADFILVGHIQVPQVVGDETPATLSSAMISDVLRGQLGFENIVITDSMSMGAITDYYQSGEAAVKAIQAGVDMILMPQDFVAAYDEVLAAVGDGRLSEDRINESVRRILTVKKERIGL